MLFTSYSFIIFITIIFILYYTIPKGLQWVLLLAASYLFYSLMSIKFLFYILFTTITTYFIGIKIGELHNIHSNYLADHKASLSREEKKSYRAFMKSRLWKWLLVCLLLNFGLLVIAKYTNFTIENINGILELIGSSKRLTFWNIALPMGISFYTFKTMSYIIDVYRGKYPPEKNIFKFALFVSYFPQLIQGPISRFDDLSETLFTEHSFDRKNLNFGLQRIMWGFFKKLVIADRMLVAVNTIIRDPEAYQGIFVFLGMLFYTYQLYADFTGGIDITIGISEVLGIKVRENFERPYFSKSITEFWRRWHITMGTWFKDYLFYPLSVWKPMLNFAKFSRNKFGNNFGKKLPVYLTTLIVWFTTGLWHGANWNFIAWGLTNGIVIIISLECKPFYNWFHNKFKVGGTFGFRLFQIIRTTLLMSAIRLFDLYRDVPMTLRMFGTIFTKPNIHMLFNGSLANLGLSLSDYFILLLGFVVLLIVSLVQRTGSVRGKIAESNMVVGYALNYALIIAILIFGAYGIGYDANQFIYNQF